MAARLRVGIVGAGIVGCASAFELASHGADVTVFDLRAPGGGATQASAGILAPYIEGHSRGELLDLARRGLEAYDGFVARVRAATSIRFEYRRTGTLEIAETPERAAILKERVPTLPAAAACEWLDARQFRSLEPAANPAHEGALLCPTHGFVAVMPFLSALADGSRHHRAKFEASRVERVRFETAGCLVQSETGSYGFDRVVLCAGSWASQLDPFDEIRDAVRPIKGQLVVLRSDGSVRRVLWGSSSYLVPWEDSSLLIGATSEDAGFDERPTAGGVQGLLRSAIELIPQLADATFVGVRVGLRPASRDGLPILRPSAADPRLVYATGHFRNGVLLAPLTAELVARYLLSGEQDPVLGRRNGA